MIHTKVNFILNENINGKHENPIVIGFGSQRGEDVEGFGVVCVDN